MQLNNIAQLLERFKNLQSNDAYIREGLQKSILEVLGEKVEKNQIKYSKGTMFLTLDPSFKTEIFLHKKAILHKTNEILGKEIVKNIV